MERGPSIPMKSVQRKLPLRGPHKVCDPSLVCAQTSIILWRWLEKGLSGGAHMDNISWNSFFSRAFRAESKVKGRACKESFTWAFQMGSTLITSNIWPLFVRQKTSGKKAFSSTMLIFHLQIGTLEKAES